LLARITRGLDEPVTACRAFGSRTLCLEADAGYYRERARALLVPHLVLLGASGCLLLAAMLLARGSSEKELRELTRIVDSAATEGNYALRASEAERSTAALARAVNQLLDEIQQRDLTLRRRTTELETVNRELEAFSYSVSHDLRSPLASIDGFSAALADFCGDQLDDSGKEYVQWIRDSVQQMNNLVAGLLQMSRVSRAELTRSPVDLSAIAQSLAGALQQRDPSRAVAFEIEPNLNVDGDERLLHAVLENLMSNAFKFTRKRDDAVIAVGSTVEGGRRAYFVRDNGAGFDTTGAARLFTPFQRLHSVSEFEGTGIGLATVRRIVERHGGTIWAEGKPGHGATFSFTLGDPRAGSGQADRDEAREGAVTT
jgi:light-regulated signal transduction histidine kinase (bacteriophytochrome)